MIVMPRWAARPSAMCAQVEKTASGECYAVTSTGHVQCAVVCWFSGGLSEVEMLSSGAAVVSVSRAVKIPS